MVIISLATTGVQIGQQIPFVISGTNITLADFTGLPALVGTFTVGEDGKAYAYLTTNADLVAEGPESFRVTLKDTGHYVDVSINDTSAYQPWMKMFTSGDILNDPILGVNEITTQMGGMAMFTTGDILNDPILGVNETTTQMDMVMFA